jgi:hypothetical protein
MIDGLELRKWMGSVEEKIVAKHAARMGLVSDPCAPCRSMYPLAVPS